MNQHDELYTIGQAAELLGIPRLRVREAIYAGLIEGRRNNRGDWLVRWDPSNTASLRDLGGRNIEPSQRIDVLFDEVDELERAVFERDETIARLTKLTANQSRLIERYATMAEGQHLQDIENHPRIQQLSQTVEKTLNTLESVINRLEASQQQSDAMGGMLDRSLNAGSRFESALRENEALVSRQRAQIDHLIGLADESIRQLEESKANRNGMFNRVFRR